MSRIPVVVLLALAVLFARPTAGAESVADLSACEARFATAPEAEDSAKCFYDLGRETEDLAPVRQMRLLLARHPGHPWLSLYLAHLMSREPEQAAPLYRDAAAGFALRRLPRGEVIARSNLQRILDDQGQADEAGREAERAEQVAEASGDAELIARAKVVRARHLFLQGQDLERVYLLLRRAEETAFPDGPYALRRECLIWLGTVSLETGRSREAQAYFQKLAELTEAEGDSFAEANARYNLARAYVDGVAELPRPGQRERAIALARQALAKANEGRHTGIQAKSHWLLGLLLTGEEAHGHLDQCPQVAGPPPARGHRRAPAAPPPAPAPPGPGAPPARRGGPRTSGPVPPGGGHSPRPELLPERPGPASGHRGSETGAQDLTGSSGPRPGGGGPLGNGLRLARTDVRELGRGIRGAGGRGLAGRPRTPPRGGPRGGGGGQ